MIAQALVPEITHEYANTRKMLEKVPVESFNWTPHDKSMKLGKLTTHIVTLPQFITLVLTTPEVDVMKGIFPPEKFANSEEMLASFDAHVAAAKEKLAAATDEELFTPWTFRRGDFIIFTMPRVAAIRTLAISHIIHHRAQLQVYLRMLNIPVPGMYGPSADEV